MEKSAIAVEAGPLPRRNEISMILAVMSSPSGSESLSSTFSSTKSPAPTAPRSLWAAGDHWARSRRTTRVSDAAPCTACEEMTWRYPQTR
jgi:hypothetical protein